MAEVIITKAPSLASRIWGSITHPINTLAGLYQKAKMDIENRRAWQKDPGAVIRDYFVTPAEAASGYSPEKAAARQAASRARHQQWLWEKRNKLALGDSTPTSYSYSSSYRPPSGASGGGYVDWAKLQAEKQAEKAEEERQRQIEKFKSNLDKAYKKYAKSLNKLAGFLPEEEARLTSGINELFSQYTDVAGKEKASELGELGRYRAETEADQRKNLEKLAERARKQFMAGSNILGSRGAGSSSAAGMYSKGLIGETNKTRQDILEQAKKIYNEIKDKEGAVNETYDLEVANMDRWVKDQAQMIKDDFARVREALMEEMRNKGEYKRADLENLDQQNLNAAYQKLTDLENRAYQYRNILTQWKENVLGKINDMKRAIIERGDFTPEELELGKPNTALEFGEQTSEDFYDPTAPKRKKVLRDFLANPFGF